MPEEKLGKKDSRRLDRFSQFACVASMEAFDMSGLDAESLDMTRFSSIVGSGVGGIMTLQINLMFSLIKDLKGYPHFLYQ